MNKKIIIGIIIGGIIFGSIGIYAGTKFYASDVSVSAPTGSNLGSNATLQDSLDELYSIADKYNELKTEINALKNNTSEEYLNKIYPVGSIYMSVNNTSPATFLGGTWEPLKDRFLIGAGNSYSVNSTGGSTSHNHSLSGNGGASIRKYGNIVYQGSITKAGKMPSADGNWWVTTANTDTNVTSSPSYSEGVGLYGNTDSKTTLPPYIAVYMWKRTK